MTTNVLSKYALLPALATLALACAGPQASPGGAGRLEGGARSPGTAIPARGAGEVAHAVDADGDGRPESWRVLAVDGRLAGTEHDGNGDGRADRWVRLGPDGLPEQIAVDLDFDGRADVTRWYDAGRLVRSEEAVPGIPSRTSPSP